MAFTFKSFLLFFFFPSPECSQNWRPTDTPFVLSIYHFIMPQSYKLKSMLGSLGLVRFPLPTHKMAKQILHISSQNTSLQWWAMQHRSKGVSISGFLHSTTRKLQSKGEVKITSKNLTQMNCPSATPADFLLKPWALLSHCKSLTLELL